MGGLLLTLKNLFLPIFCKACGERLLTEENGFFCPDCWDLSPRIARPFCTLCGRPHKGAVGFGTQSNFPCALCRALPQKKRPARRIAGAAYYDGPIGEAIRLFKFQGRPALAGPLGETLTEFALRELTLAAYDALAPVPLFRTRERERGYNQSALLAREVQPHMPGAGYSEALKRHRPTRAQSQLKTPEERRKNVSGAFSMADDHGLEGKTVLLVDDVVTTGGTVMECARVLRRAGAAAVDVLAVALAVKVPGAPAPRRT